MAERSEKSRLSVLQSTLRLLGIGAKGGTSVRKLTIEAIAHDAGVSKATIYRWWDSKTAVVLDAFVSEYLRNTPVRDDLPFAEALRAHVSSVVHQYSGVDGEIVAQLVAESQYDTRALSEFHQRFWDDRRAAVLQLIQRGIVEGVVRTDIDQALIGSMVYASIYQRLLFKDGPLDARFADEIVTLALGGLTSK